MRLSLHGINKVYRRGTIPSRPCSRVLLGMVRVYIFSHGWTNGLTNEDTGQRTTESRPQCLLDTVQLLHAVNKNKVRTFFFFFEKSYDMTISFQMLFHKLESQTVTHGFVLYSSKQFRVLPTLASILSKIRRLLNGCLYATKFSRRQRSRRRKKNLFLFQSASNQSSRQSLLPPAISQMRGQP